MASVSFHAVDLDAADARLRVAIERAVVRFPGEAIGADFGECVVRAGAAAVGRHAGFTQQPAVTLAGEVALGETALAIESP